MATLLGVAEAATHDGVEVVTKLDGGSNPLHLLFQTEKEHTSSDEARSQQERTRVRRRREKQCWNGERGLRSVAVGFGRKKDHIMVFHIITKKPLPCFYILFSIFVEKVENDDLQFPYFLSFQKTFSENIFNKIKPNTFSPLFLVFNGNENRKYLNQTPL